MARSSNIRVRDEKFVDATRLRILQAASELFALQGFEATTLRQITDAAQANLASVNYHFRSKEELVANTIEAAIVPIVAARMAALEQCLNKETRRVEDIASALVRPLYELSFGEHRNRLMLLMQLKPDPETSRHELVSKHFAPLHQEFVHALEAALPKLSRAEAALRYDCARGAVLQTLVELAPARELVSLTVDQKQRLKKREALISALVTFVSAGFSAPPSFGNRS